MKMIKPILSTAVAVALGAGAAQAAESKYVVDMSDNLYYSGLTPKTADPYFGTYIAPFGYPETPMQRKDNYAVGVPFHDCPRDKRKVENGAEVEIQMPDGQTITVEETNTFPDVRTACYGTPPVIIPVSEIPTVGGASYIRVEGRIDENTSQDLTAGTQPIDGRGSLDADHDDNGMALNSLIGLWVTADSGFNEAAMKAHVNAAYDGGAQDALDGLGKNTGGELLNDYGFTKVGEEFEVVSGLNNISFQDNDADSVADQGTGEFGGQLTVPNDATHLMLAFNSHKGGFYHHGDTAYIGADNPLHIAGLAQDYDEINLATVNEPDTFTDDRVFGASNDSVGGNYAAGDTRAVGVFMVTLSDDASIANTSGSPKAVIGVGSTATKTIQFDGTGSETNGLSGTMTYLWDFGDNTATSTEAKPSHTYAAGGNYEVTLTVTLADRSNFAVKTVSVDTGTGSGSSGSSGGGGGGAFGLMGLLPMIGLMRRRRR